MTKGYAEMDDSRCFLSLYGHATGSCEVCAAISALAYAMAGYLTNAELEGRAEVYTMKMEGGSVVIHASGDERCVGACEAVLLGLRQIAEQYPDYLSMDFLEE